MIPSFQNKTRCLAPCLAEYREGLCVRVQIGTENVTRTDFQPLTALRIRQGAWHLVLFLELRQGVVDAGEDVGPIHEHDALEQGRGDHVPGNGHP